MPLLLIIGAGALLGVGAYLGAHLAAHLLRKIPYFSNWPILKSMDGKVTAAGALASAAIGAAALPLAIVGAGALGAALGLEILPPAIGAAAGTVATVGGDVVDHSQQDTKPVVTNTVPVTKPVTKPVETPAPVTTKTQPTDPVAKNPPAQQQQQQTTPPAQKQTPVSPKNQYVVKKGDTLSGIAQEEHVSLGALEHANPTIGTRKHPIAFKSGWDFIVPGDVVDVPTAAPPPAKTNGATGALGKVAALGADQ